MTQSVLIALFSVTALFSLFEKKKTSLNLFIIIIVAQVLIVTFRPESMADYENYANAFGQGADRFEPIYQGMFKMLHQVDCGELSFFFCMALLTVGIKGCAVWRMSTLPLLSLVVWVSDIMIIQDMIAIRAALASAFLLWIIYNKVEQKTIYMWIAIVLAVCSHYSALILLVIPFLSTKKMHRKGYVFANYFKVIPRLKHRVFISRCILEIQKAVLTNDCKSLKTYRRLLIKNIISRYITNRLRVKMALLILCPSISTKILEKRSMS